jgi:FixJ family two-component response regulator
MNCHSVSENEIYVVDDDEDVRETLSVVLGEAGYRVQSFAEGNSFLAAMRSRKPGCVILDVNMPGRSGIDVLKALAAQNYHAPIFVVSGQAEIPLAVDAIRNGAMDFIAKPFDIELVIERVRTAMAEWVRRHDSGILMHRFPGHHLLTPREHDVLAQIASGASNKEAGRRLNISPRTIEVHRARIMDKLGAKNAADLVRIVLSEAAIGH